MGESCKWAGVEKRKERKRKGHCLGPWFGPANGGGKWAKLGCLMGLGELGLGHGLGRCKRGGMSSGLL